MRIWAAMGGIRGMGGVKMSEANLISAEKLRALTGLTDKVHRGLAARGFFPAPVRGQYQAAQTLVGMFRYYRELAEGRGTEVYYDSMGSCAAQLEIPEAVLKAAKRKGCPAFKASRVYLLPLVKWLGAKPADGEETTNWAQVKLKFQAKREGIRLLKDERAAADWNEIAWGLNKGTALLQSSLERRFALTLPRKLKGMAELQIQKELLGALEKGMAEFRAEIARLGDLKE